MPTSRLCSSLRLTRGLLACARATLPKYQARTSTVPKCYSTDAFHGKSADSGTSDPAKSSANRILTPSPTGSSFDTFNADQARLLDSERDKNRTKHIRVPKRTETRTWKIVGDFKYYKPATPGLRHRQHPTRLHLYPGRPVLRLSPGKRSTGGRNNTGRITVRGRGGGHKRRLRNVDFRREVPGEHVVERLEYDPNRSADIALLKHIATGEYSYIVCPDGLVPGDSVFSFRNTPIPKNMTKVQALKPGNVFRLRDLPVGTTIHNISLKPDGLMILCRAAGTCGQVVSTSNKGFAQIKLQSGEVRLIPVDACATVGQVGNKAHMHTQWGKAGAARHRGFRPITRGVAKNAVDHPNGGGYKKKGNKPPRSPWGWKTHGKKTVRKEKKWLIKARGKDN